MQRNIPVSDWDEYTQTSKWQHFGLFSISQLLTEKNRTVVSFIVSLQYFSNIDKRDLLKNLNRCCVV